MLSLSSRMPPFAGLLAFEAVLRHGSMTLAGDELGLTQSAISHRIRALEDFFCVALLERLNPGLRATEAGTRLSQELAPLLGTLAGLRRRIAGQTGRRIFRLGLSTSLLAWWLSPRLPALCAGFPDLSVEVVTWNTPAEAARAEVDLRSLLAADALHQGRLMRLTGPDEMHACSKKQIAQWRDPQDSTAERMATWLVLSAGQSVAVSNQAPVAIA